MGVDFAWDRIEIWLKANARTLWKSLRSAAKPSAVQKAESTLGVRLPPDFAASVRRHNGQSVEAEGGLFPHRDKQFGLEPAWRLLPLSEIINVWEQLKALLDAGEYARETFDSAPGVQPVWWCPGWVPVADNGGGDHLCLDTTPSEGGRVGQVVVFQHDSRTRPLLANSFEELLTRLADGMESGKYAFNEAEGLVEAMSESSEETIEEKPITDRFFHRVILLPTERPTTEQIHLVRELSSNKQANLLEIRKLLITGGKVDFGYLIGTGLAQIVARLDQVGIPHRLEATPDPY